MATQSSVLPRRFPVGTKFVIEDRGVGGADAYRRYLVFPDGRRIDVPAAKPRSPAATIRRRRPRRR
jgi:hypothetical protein